MIVSSVVRLIWLIGAVVEFTLSDNPGISLSILSIENRERKRDISSYSSSNAIDHVEEWFEDVANVSFIIQKQLNSISYTTQPNVCRHPLPCAIQSVIVDYDVFE